MKPFLKSIVAGMLAIFARIVIHKYKPKIVMVTGSVGKTSTKDALATVLRERFYLRASAKSYNTEFGVPYTIFGARDPWKSIWRWILIFKEALALIVLPNHYPKLLVLEVSAERPGDLAKILKIATPDAVVVTRLPDVPVHVEAYASPQAVREEEFAPAYALPPGGALIVSADDPFALKMAKRMPVTLTTFGQHEDADVRISEISFYTLKNKVLGMQAKVSGSVGKGKLVVKGAIGYQQALPAAAAVAGAHALGIALKDALSGLDAYDAPPGRGRLLNGKNDSLLIDDSYNASPAAVEEVLRTLKDFPGAKRRIAVIGDMLELGRYSVSEHARIGKLAFESADIVISVGIRAREVQATKHFNTAWDAASDLTKMIEPGDVVLIKGSQSIRMERIVEALLADKADQKRLVRQEPEWKRLA